MGFLSGLNPVIRTSNAHAKVLKKAYRNNWDQFEENMPLIFAGLVEQRYPLKHRFPQEHKQFIQDCLNSKFINLTDFILEIIRVEFYHKQGFIPYDEELIHRNKIEITLRKQGLPENII